MSETSTSQQSLPSAFQTYHNTSNTIYQPPPTANPWLLTITHTNLHVQRKKQFDPFRLFRRRESVNQVDSTTHPSTSVGDEDRRRPMRKQRSLFLRSNSAQAKKSKAIVMEDHSGLNGLVRSEDQKGAGDVWMVSVSQRLGKNTLQHQNTNGSDNLSVEGHKSMLKVYINSPTHEFTLSRSPKEIRHLYRGLLVCKPNLVPTPSGVPFLCNVNDDLSAGRERANPEDTSEPDVPSSPTSRRMSILDALVKIRHPFRSNQTSSGTDSKSISAHSNSSEESDLLRTPGRLLSGDHTSVRDGSAGKNGDLALGRFEFEVDDLESLTVSPEMRSTSQFPRGSTISSEIKMTMSTQLPRFKSTLEHPESSYFVERADVGTSGMLPVYIPVAEELAALSSFLTALANQPDVRSTLVWSTFCQTGELDLINPVVTLEQTRWQRKGFPELFAVDLGSGIAKNNDLQPKPKLKKSKSYGGGFIKIPVYEGSVVRKNDPVNREDPSALVEIVEKDSHAISAARDEVDILSPVLKDVTKTITSTLEMDVATLRRTSPPPVSHVEQGFNREIEKAVEEEIPDIKPDPLAAFGPPQSPGVSDTKQIIKNDFELIRVLGKGCSGKVMLVRHKGTRNLFAMKVIVKRAVFAHRELKHTRTEQAVLKRMSGDASDHTNPFVVKLWCSFHDHDNLFLVLSFHPGGDLATQLSRWGRLGRDRARFYTSEIVEGVEGLHAAGVIYRDLKPENVLISADGHIVLVDFGLAAHFPDSRGPSAVSPSWMGKGTSTPLNVAGHVVGQKTSNRLADVCESFVGTAEYLAPEVIQGFPYSYEVDWWSLGTMLYEALVGNTPFWSENHRDMYMRVVHDELTFPEERVLDKDTKSFIRGLLQKDPAFRLSEPRIKKHPYLSMVNFEHIRSKRYILNDTLDYDVQNFDKQFLEMDVNIESDLTEIDQDVVDAIPAEEWSDAFVEYTFQDDAMVSILEVTAELDAELSKAEPQSTTDDAQVLKEPISPGEDQTPTAHMTASPARLRNDSSIPSSISSVADQVSKSSSASADTKEKDPAPTLPPDLSARPEPSARLLERIETIANDDHIKNSRHSRDLVRPIVAENSSRDDDWDLLEGDSVGYAVNGRRQRDTLMGRGVVDRYRLAVIRRRESTIKRKLSIRMQRQPSATLSASSSGTNQAQQSKTNMTSNAPNLATLKARLRARGVKRRSKPATAPPIGRSGQLAEDQQHHPAGSDDDSLSDNQTST